MKDKKEKTIIIFAGKIYFFKIFLLNNHYYDKIFM